MIVGIDEVGRGCLAGPLVAGAVVLREPPLSGLKDSKVLSARERTRLAAIIESEAISFGLGWVSAAELDTLGLTRATALAMRRALASITAPYDEIIIDGKFNFLHPNPKVQTLVKADALVPAVSAASIIAKVARDAHMAQQALKHPQYSFERHVGYGTAAHLAAIELHGLCPLHRRRFKPVQARLA